MMPIGIKGDQVDAPRAAEGDRAHVTADEDVARSERQPARLVLSLANIPANGDRLLPEFLDVIHRDGPNRRWFRMLHVQAGYSLCDPSMGATIVRSSTAQLGVRIVRRRTMARCSGPTAEIMLEFIENSASQGIAHARMGMVALMVLAETLEPDWTPPRISSLCLVTGYVSSRIYLGLRWRLPGNSGRVSNTVQVHLCGQASARCTSGRHLGYTRVAATAFCASRAAARDEQGGSIAGWGELKVSVNRGQNGKADHRSGCRLAVTAYFR